MLEIAALTLALAALALRAPAAPPPFEPAQETSPGAVAAPHLELTQETLERLTAEALPAVREALGARFPDGVQVRLATTKEIEDALFDENRVLLENRMDPGEAESQAHRFASALAPALMAKYRLGEHEVLVGAAAFPKLASVLDMPELETEGAVRAVLVHELAHAASDELYDAGRTLLSLDTADRVQAYSALLEGYAQHAARRICTAHGWSEGFDVYSRAIAGVPAESQGAGIDMLLRLKSEVFASQYRDGERFVAAIEKEGGRDAVERAFREPPVDSAVIFEPRWFLHPETRPALLYDLDVALDGFQKSYPADTWSATRVTMTTAQLRAALALLPAESVQRALDGMRTARVLSLTLAAAPGSVLDALALYELASPEDARGFLLLERQLLEAKDEAMKEGALRVLASDYEEFSDGGVDGFWSKKRLKVGDQEVLVVSAYAVRGRVCGELLFSNEATGVEEARRRVTAAVRAALATAEADAPAGSEPSGGSGEGAGNGKGGEEGDSAGTPPSDGGSPPGAGPPARSMSPGGR